MAPLFGGLTSAYGEGEAKALFVLEVCRDIFLYAMTPSLGTRKRCALKVALVHYNNCNVRPLFVCLVAFERRRVHGFAHDWHFMYSDVSHPVSSLVM